MAKDNYVYEEYRNYRSGDINREYSAMLTDLATVQTGSGEKLIMNSELINMFSLSNFNANVFDKLGDNKFVISDGTLVSLSNAYAINNNGEYNRHKSIFMGSNETLAKYHHYIIDENPNTKDENQTDVIFYNFLRLNPTLLNYYDKLHTFCSDVNEYNHNEIMKSVDPLECYMTSCARLVIKYFTFTTIFYALMYEGTNVNFKYKDKIDFSLITNKENFRDALIDIIYDLEDRMNVKNQLFNANVSENIQLHTKFSQNDKLLEDKEDKFNAGKSKLITLMSKSKKIKSQYATRSFWHMVYLILLIIYILTVLSLVYAGVSDITAFQSVNKGLMGSVLVVLCAVVMCGIFLYDILRMIFKW